MDETDLGFNMRRLRTNRRMKQREVAKLIGMGSASIVNYEAGATRPNESKIILLSKIFQVTPDLLKGTAFQQGNTTAYAAFQLKMDELQAKPLEQREFLLEHIYQMNKDLLRYAVEAAYKKTLDRF